MPVQYNLSAEAPSEDEEFYDNLVFKKRQRQTQPMIQNYAYEMPIRHNLRVDSPSPDEVFYDNTAIYDKAS